MTNVQLTWVLIVGVVSLSMMLDTWGKSWGRRGEHRANAERYRAERAQAELELERERNRPPDHRRNPPRSILGGDFPFHYESTVTRTPKDHRDDTELTD